MFHQNRLCGLFLLAVALSFVYAVDLRAQQPAQFPWGNQDGSWHSKVASENVYRVLPGTMHSKHQPVQAPVQLHAMPMRSPYAYGWFGSNPSSQWGRHFGHSWNYTQWTRR